MIALLTQHLNAIGSERSRVCFFYCMFRCHKDFEVLLYKGGKRDSSVVSQTLTISKMLAIDLIITVLARLSYVNENILNIDKIRIRQKTLKETKLGLVNYLFLLDFQVPDTNNG